MIDKAERRGEAGFQVNYDELPTYLGYQLRRVQSQIFGEFERALGDLDLTHGAFGLLTLVRANPGITQMDLAEAFGIDKSTLTPVLHRLESRGLIRREQVAHDRRYNALYFEPEQETYYLRARERIRAFERAVAERLNEDELAQLTRLIGKLKTGP